MRSENLSPKPRGALLDAPANTYASQSRGPGQPAPTARRDFAEDFAGRLPDPRETQDGDDGFDYRRQRSGYKVRFRGRFLQIPRSLWGRIAGAFVLLILAGGAAAAAVALRSFFLHDSRFTIASSSSLQIVGNIHLSRSQLLSVFGEDVERNIFEVPLAARRAELEQLPWLAHATVMRLLPNHIRVAVVERTPVAFVRQGTQIGMVDASGVLLDMPPDAPGDPLYSFPVVTGISGGDPLSTRAARMKIYAAFTTDLDSTGEHISAKLSEVDLSNPEDVKALIPEGSSDVLVHFGDSAFLARYQKFEGHLAEWRTQYPKLASVDMRYERQVVLEMQPGSSAGTVGTLPPAPLKAQPPAAVAGKTPVKSAERRPGLQTKPVVSRSATQPDGPPLSPPDTSQEWHMVVVKPHTKKAAQPAIPAQPVHPPPAARQ